MRSISQSRPPKAYGAHTRIHPQNCRDDPSSGLRRPDRLATQRSLAPHGASAPWRARDCDLADLDGLRSRVRSIAPASS